MYPKYTSPFGYQTGVGVLTPMVSTIITLACVMNWSISLPGKSVKTN